MLLYSGEAPVLVYVHVYTVFFASQTLTPRPGFDACTVFVLFLSAVRSLETGQEWKAYGSAYDSVMKRLHKGMESTTGVSCLAQVITPLMNVIITWHTDTCLCVVGHAHVPHSKS